MADVTEPNATGASDGQDLSVDQKVINQLNSIVSSHLKRALPKMLGEVIEAQIAPLKEQFAPKAPEPSKAPAGDEIAAKLADLEKQLKKERETRVSIQRQAREEKAFGELRSELTGKVRPEAVDTVAKLLFKAEGRVKVGDDGTISFVHGDNEHDLKGGVAEWVKSKDAALFVPPPVAQQKNRLGITPSRPAPQAPANREAPMSPEERLQKSLRDLGLG